MMGFINDPELYAKFLEHEASQVKEKKSIQYGLVSFRGDHEIMKDFDTTDRYKLLSWSEFSGEEKDDSVDRRFNIERRHRNEMNELRYKHYLERIELQKLEIEDLKLSDFEGKHHDT
jgi:hypothetical protein